MNIVLKNQVEASEKSARELEEELRHQHRRAMLCYDVQDLARSAVNLFGEINGDVERWHCDHDRVAATLSGLSEQVGEEWHGLYRRLAAVFEKTAGLIRAMQQEQFVVEEKREFLAAWRDLRGVVGFSPDRIAAAAEQVKRGETRPLGDVERELCDFPAD